MTLSNFFLAESTSKICQEDWIRGMCESNFYKNFYRTHQIFARKLDEKLGKRSKFKEIVLQNTFTIFQES